MFCKGDTVIYPIHGIANIIKIEEIEFNGEKRQYYKLEFPAKSLSISVPAQSATNIGLRKPLEKRTLLEALNKLSTKNKVPEEELEKIVEDSQELLNSGITQDSVSVINHIRAWKQIREGNGKMLTTSCRNYLTIAQDFLKQEVELVLGEKALSTYGLA